MAVSDEQVEFVLDLFSDLGPITTRKMMGGMMFYHDGVIFAALMRDGRVQLKGAGDFADALDAAGWERWTYQRAGSDKVTAMPYWVMPEALLDDPEEACAWARRALSALND